MAQEAQWPDIIHLASDGYHNQDLTSAIQESLAIHNGQHQQTTWHSSSSPEADDDADLQQALALSMQMFEAEQQYEQLLPQQAASAPRQPNKRSHSPEPAGIQPQGLQPADPGTEGLKRQRSSITQLPCQDAGSAAVAALQELAARAGANALLALQHTSQPQQPVIQQQQAHQQQSPATVKQGDLQGIRGPCPDSAARAAPAAAETDNTVCFGLGHSGSVQDIKPCAGDIAGGVLNNCSGIDDMGLYDWSESLSGSGIAGGSGAGDDAAERGEYDHVLDQGQWHHPQQMLLLLLRQQQQKQQQKQQVALIGRGSKVLEVGARRLYQQGEAVWWTDPFTSLCHHAVVFGADTLALPAQPGAEKHYIVSVEQYAVQYVEASTSQLLPQLYPGDRVWCKPAMALALQFSGNGAQQHQHQQQAHAAQAAGAAAGRDPWLLAPWVLGLVKTSKVHNSVPVLHVQLSTGGSCWFPVMHVEKVTETGESSSTAQARGSQQVALAAAADPTQKAAAGQDDTGYQQQQIRQKLQQQHPQQQGQQPVHQEQQHQQKQEQQAHQQHGERGFLQDAAADPAAPASNSSGPAHSQEHSAVNAGTGSVLLDATQAAANTSAAALVAAPVLPSVAAQAANRHCCCPGGTTMVQCSSDWDSA